MISLYRPSMWCFQVQFPLWFHIFAYTNMFMGRAKNCDQYSPKSNQVFCFGLKKFMSQNHTGFALFLKEHTFFFPTWLEFASNIFCLATKFSTLVTKVWLPSLVNFDEIDKKRFCWFMSHVLYWVMENGTWYRGHFSQH